MIPLFIFIVCAALAVAGAITLIWAREPIHSALARPDERDGAGHGERRADDEDEQRDHR